MQGRCVGATSNPEWDAPPQSVVVEDPSPAPLAAIWLRMKDLPWRARPQTATTAIGPRTARRQSWASSPTWKFPASSHRTNWSGRAINPVAVLNKRKLLGRVRVSPPERRPLSPECTVLQSIRAAARYCRKQSTIHNFWESSRDGTGFSRLMRKRSRYNWDGQAFQGWRQYDLAARSSKNFVWICKKCVTLHGQQNHTW